jgi:diguanylate cyclase
MDSLSIWVPGILVSSLTLLYFLLAFILFFVPKPECRNDQLALRYFIVFFAMICVSFICYLPRFLSSEWTIVSVIFVNFIYMLGHYCLHIGLCYRSQTRSVLMKPIVARSAVFLYIIGMVYLYFSARLVPELYRYVTAPLVLILLFFSLQVLQVKQAESHLGNKLMRFSLCATIAALLVHVIAAMWLDARDVRFLFVAFISMMTAGILLLGGIYGSFLNDTVERHFRNSITDALTGLYNRRYLIDESRKLVAAATRHLFPLSVVICDIDKFKNINDTYGHDVGDEVIKTFAKVLKGCIRTEDILARWGGEEFVILLSATGVEKAKVLAERMREETGRLSVDTGSGSLAFTASFGVAVIDEGSDVETAIKHADEALYRAKEGGRNCVEVNTSLLNS